MKITHSSLNRKSNTSREIVMKSNFSFFFFIYSFFFAKSVSESTHTHTQTRTSVHWNKPRVTNKKKHSRLNTHLCRTTTKLFQHFFFVVSLTGFCLFCYCYCYFTLYGCGFSAVAYIAFFCFFFSLDVFLVFFSSLLVVVLRAFFCVNAYDINTDSLLLSRTHIDFVGSFFFSNIPSLFFSNLIYAFFLQPV